MLCASQIAFNIQLMDSHECFACCKQLLAKYIVESLSLCFSVNLTNHLSFLCLHVDFEFIT